MKQPVLWFTLSFMLICQVNASIKTDREHDGFVGPVRAVRLEQCSLVKKSGEWVEDPRVLWQAVAYDSDGRLTERVFYNRDQSIWSRIVYVYDSAGTRSDTVYRATKGGSPQAAGSDQTQAMREFTRSRRTFEYDSSGNRTEEADYTKEGNLSQRTVYAFDANGLVKEIIEYATDGSVRSGYSNKYDHKGRIIEQHRGDSPGATARSESYAYEFDSTGNWIKRVTTAYPRGLGKPAAETKDVIYRTITYDSSKVAAEVGRAIDTSTDLTGGTDPLITRPIIIRKSGGVFQSSAVTRVEPTYPANAVAKRIGGSVVVEVTVDEDGSVMSVRALSGPDELRGAAVSAAREWKFHPTALSGIPVKVIGTITFNFNL
jgi:TonB family protein